MWHIAVVRTGAELDLARDLPEQTYIPECKVKTRIRGRRKRCTVAAWPGYLLIFDPGPIDDSRLYFFLMEDGERAFLPDEEVEQYKLWERMGAYERREKAKKLLGIGDAVKTPVRPWEDRVGYIQGMENGLVLVGGGDFPKPVRIPLALLLPKSGVE